MGKRDDYVPEDFIEALRRGVPGFEKQSQRHQVKLAFYAWTEGLHRYSHRAWHGYISIGYKALEKDFGRGNFQAINAELGMFEVTPNWSKDKHLTKGYRLTKLVRKVKERYLKPRDEALTRLITMNGNALRTLPKPIAAKDSAGITATAWRKAKPLNIIPVDLNLLNWLYGHLERMMRYSPNGDLFAKADYDEITYYIEILGQLIKTAHTDIAGRGYVIHRYMEAKTGRLYAKGISLQTVPRLIRKAALHGLYEYDFENCHYDIFYQMADRYGYQCEAIRYYLSHKKEVREGIAKRVGIRIEDAKTCLLALMYGARTTEWHSNAIPMEIGKEAASRLYKDQEFSAIAEDIRQGRKVIIAGWPKRRTTLLNDLGKPVKTKEKIEVIQAHLIQGVEAKALKKVLDLYPTETVLLMHDGFVTTRPIDMALIEREVYTETGYRLTLSGSLISLPADLEFSKT